MLHIYIYIYIYIYDINRLRVKLVTRMRQMFTFASLFLCPEERAPCGGGDSQSKCGRCWIIVKSIALDWNRTPNRPARSLVAMWTTLSDYMDSPSGPRPPQ